MKSLQIDSNIEWDGERLSALVSSAHGQFLCIVPREAIHAISIYNDAVGWEIDRYRNDIFDRLKAAIYRKSSSGQRINGQLQLNASDVICVAERPRNGIRG
jgi:hypothetical protein